jgi:hypothetical protein
MSKKSKAKSRKAAKPPRPRTALDPATGALKLDDWDTALAPALTRKAFLALPLGKTVRDLVVNEPWHSWQLADCKIGGRPFLLGVFYEGERLDMVQLFLQDRRYGTSWEDFSPEKEKARHAAHWRWLRSQLGNAGTRSPAGDERRFAWGSAGAYYDPRNEESSIVISYGKDDRS